MPKITVRDDGICFVRASVHPGSGEVRTWEVKKEGVAWLRRQGIGVEQEMGRSRFHQLLELCYAYIANRSAKRKTAKTTKPVPKIKTKTGSSPAGTYRIFTSKASDLNSESTSSRKRKRRERYQRATGESAPLATNTAPLEQSDPTVPEHWNRRTKKKDWFG